jgi:hypothetical protein
MAFLRIKNPEQLKAKSPGELGIIMGLGRCQGRCRFFHY